MRWTLKIEYKNGLVSLEGPMDWFEALTQMHTLLVTGVPVKAMTVREGGPL